MSKLKLIKKGFKQKGINRKKEIFNTFVSLVVENGYEGVSIRDITRKIGIREASLYYYYPSKEAMLDEVFDYFKYNIILTVIDDNTIDEMIATRGGYITLQSCLIEFKKIMEEKTMCFAWRIVETERYKNPKAHELLSVHLHKLRISFYERLFRNLMLRKLISGTDPYLLATEHYHALISMFTEYNLLKFYEKRTHKAEQMMFDHIEFMWNKIC